MNKPEIPNDVFKILKKLNSKGHEAYIVGGCVRDFCLSRIPQDWDITTSALPQDVKSCFNRTFDTGIKHGTVTVVINKNNYEVTTYRIDGKYSDGRHPEEVVFTRNIEEDLLRRDFTMNAIAYHPEKGFIDPFNGMNDISNKIIRGVGNPSLRFQEDALRMLRAVRFSSQLGFEIEKETEQALTENVNLIKKISAERIKSELQKLILSHHIENLPILWETGLLNNISKEIDCAVSPYGDIIIKQLKSSKKNIVLCWSIFLQFVKHEEIKKILLNLKFDTKTIKTIILIINHINDTIYEDEYIIRKTAYIMGIDEFKLLLEIKKIQNCKNAEAVENLLNTVLKNKNCIFLNELNISGEDLLEMGIEKGRKIGVTLIILLDIVHKFPENNTNEILKYIVREKFI